MRPNISLFFLALAACLVLAMALLQLVAPVESKGERSQRQVATLGREHFDAVKLFDFKTYKKIFKKKYPSKVENMVRAKLFMSRAFRVFISATKFRYHLGLNRMSDMSREELSMRINRVLKGQFGGKNQRDSSAPTSEPSNHLSDLLPANDDENPVEAMRRVLDARKGEPAIDDMRAQLARLDPARLVSLGGGRRKRDVVAADSPAVQKPPRDLPLDRLISWPSNTSDPYAELSAETRAKIRTHPPTNNPHYEPLELATQGLFDQQVRLNRIEFVGPASSLFDDLYQQMNDEQNYNYNMDYYNYGGESSSSYYNHIQAQPDEVFLDLRRTSNCFLPARDQGNCGACYAFAGIALAEWMHCRVTGTLVAFSEQIMVDCGKAFAEGIYGCAGGRASEIADYFQNFGFELERHYSYRGVEGDCPYLADTDLLTTGYIRADLRNSIRYDMDSWAEMLGVIGPLIVNINIGGFFTDYAAGVYDDCIPDHGFHTVLVIGHGRENGIEYWLIRNSYGDDWGQRGYLKLSKQADCISPRSGFTFGTDDGRTISMSAEKNHANRQHRQNRKNKRGGGDGGGGSSSGGGRSSRSRISSFFRGG